MELIIDFTFDKEHNTSRFLEFFAHFLNGMGTDDFRSFRLISQKLINLIRGSVVCTDNVAMIIHVQNDVLAHHCQPDEGNICLLEGNH
jgi:hypothetical protein